MQSDTSLSLPLDLKLFLLLLVAERLFPGHVVERGKVFSDELHSWLQTAPHPRCFSSLAAVDTDKGLLRVQLKVA